jgi:hypothetical protein
MQISQNVKVVKVMNAVAAGTTSQNGSSVDMQGFDGVMFIAHLGTLTTSQVTKLQAQGSDDNSTFAAFSTDAVTAAMADADSNKVLVLDVFRPVHRYVRPTVERGTANAVINSVIAILYSSDKEPIALDSSVSQLSSFVSP